MPRSSKTDLEFVMIVHQVVNAHSQKPSLLAKCHFLEAINSNECTSVQIYLMLPHGSEIFLVVPLVVTI